MSILAPTIMHLHYLSQGISIAISENVEELFVP